MGSHKLKATALLAVAAAMVWGCESSDVLAPSGSQISIEANPTTIVIDLDADEESGQSQISAQLFDMSGAFPLDGVDVTFSTTGGTLASATNACGTGGTCTLSPDSCSTASDCPTVPAQSVKTDTSGVARDILTLSRDDVTPVDVTARSSTFTATVAVDKMVVEGNLPPTALIEVTPETGQRLGSPVTFDGTGSTDPDDPRITCYQWQIVSSEPSRNEVVQASTASRVTRTYNVEQDLSVTLMVSDRENPDVFCDSTTEAPVSFFSDMSFNVPYIIRCDVTEPIAQAGPATRTVIINDGSVTVNLNSVGSSDPESGIVSYSWSCGDDDPVEQTGTTAACTYTTATPADSPYIAQLTVINGCGDPGIDTVSITVLADATP